MGSPFDHTHLSGSGTTPSKIPIVLYMVEMSCLARSDISTEIPISLSNLASKFRGVVAPSSRKSKIVIAPSLLMQERRGSLEEESKV